MKRDYFPKWIVDLGLISVLILVDQIIKFAFSEWFLEGETKEIIKGFFSFELVLNQKAIFGIAVDQAFLITGTVLILAALVFIYFKKVIKEQDYLQRLGIILVIAGALSNLWDRIFLGHIIDWIKFSFWPAFNLADLLIIVGLIIFGWTVLFKGKTD